MMANVEILPGKYITCSKEVEEALRDILQKSYDKIEEQRKEIAKLKLDLSYKHMDRSVASVLEYKYHALLQAALTFGGSEESDREDVTKRQILDLLKSCQNKQCKHIK